MKKRFSAFAILIAVSSFAQDPAATVPVSRSSTPEPTKVADPVPAGPIVQVGMPRDPVAPPSKPNIQQYESAFKRDKTKQAVPGLAKVLRALEKKQYAAVLKNLRALEYNLDFKDYYHHLSGEAEFGRMRQFLAQKQWANAILAGNQASFHFSQVQTASAYTPLGRRAITLLGETEVAMGDALFRQSKRLRSVMSYESGFQRLTQANRLSLVPQSSIVNYALMCEKYSTDVCTSWEARLAPFVVKSSDSRVLDRIAAFKAPNGITVEKTTAIPYKVDLDFQAFQSAFDLYLAAKYEAAYVGFRNLLEQFPRTNIKLRTKFWMARSAQKSGHDVQAETLYREVIRETPFSYYALLSSWFGDINLSRMMTAELPTPANEIPLLTPADVVHIKRAEKFLASDAPVLARYELGEVNSKNTMSNEFLVYLALLNHLSGNHLAVFQIFGEFTTRGYQGFFSTYGTKLVFPKEFFAEVQAECRKNEIDPNLILGLMKQESAFIHDAVSTSAAYGLMQIIRPTAKDLDPRVEVQDLFEPAKNIRLGTKYVRQLLNKFKGNIILALAGYNAGPGNAERWSREAAMRPSAISAPMPPEEFIELIGFRETREYVSNIIRNFYWYTRRENGEGFASLKSLLHAAGLGNRAPAWKRGGTHRPPRHQATR